MNINKIKEINHPEVFQINSKPYGQPYVKWTEKWWQWAFSISKNQNPIIDKTGKKCHIGQEGPVWYLAGTTGNTYHAERSCVIPRTRSILFPIIVSQFSHSEKPSMMQGELTQFTAKDIDQISKFEVVIDNIQLPNLASIAGTNSFN